MCCYSFEFGPLLLWNNNYSQCYCCNWSDRLCLDGTKRFHSDRSERYYSKLYGSNGWRLHGYSNGCSYLHRIYNRCCKSNANNESNNEQSGLCGESINAVFGRPRRGLGRLDWAGICCFEPLSNNRKRYGGNDRKLYRYSAFKWMPSTANTSCCC